MTLRMITAAVLFAAAVHVPAAAAGEGRRAGSPGRGQARALAAGVTLTRHNYGRPPANPWTVVVRPAATRMLSSAAEARRLLARLKARKLRGTAQRIRTPALADLEPRSLGRLVRVGRFRTAGQAERLAAHLRKPLRHHRKGLAATVVPVAADGGPASGPWRVRVVRADPRLVTFRTTYGPTLARAETVRAMARGEVAAVNGGYFHIGSAIPGDPVGVYVQAGRLLSGDRGRRSALLLDNGRPRVTELRTGLRIRLRARSWPSRINQPPGRDDLVTFTPEYGRAALPRITGLEVQVDAATGMVLGTHPRTRKDPAGRLQPGQTVIQATGAAAGDLAGAVQPVDRITWRGRLTDQRTGRPVPLGPRTYAVGGNVTLVRDGRVHINAHGSGVASRWGAFYGMVMRRGPRTAAGVDRQGRLLLVTVDGRQPGFSIGMTMPETAALLRRLGAVDAVNLDGGGSTTMVAAGRLTNRPSDAGHRERPVGNAVVISSAGTPPPPAPPPAR